MRWFFLALLLSGSALAQTPPTPEPAVQDHILELMHGYADQYVTKLPNFICDQVLRESESVNPGKWKKGDKVVSKLSFHDGREDRSIESVNGKKVKPGAPPRPLPLTTEGEFGMLLGQVLGKDSEAYFNWNRWETLRGKELAVFDFGVDKEHSNMSLGLNGGSGTIVGYQGSVYADPDTGKVWRIEYTAKDIPPKLQTRQISTVVDYSETAIGTKRYLLPMEATVTLVLWTRDVRNELEFQSYRKFGAETSITFDGAEPAK
jgi:hypothetical protein